MLYFLVTPTLIGLNFTVALFARLRLPKVYGVVSDARPIEIGFSPPRTAEKIVIMSDNKANTLIS